MKDLIELVGGINLRGSKIRDYANRSGLQTLGYAVTDRSYASDCSDCNCDCSQGGDCDCTSAECEN